MGFFSSWLNRYRKHKARAYLSAHHEVAAAVLRQHPDLAATAVERAFELTAGGAGMDARETTAWPTLTQLGQGGRAPAGLTLPKMTPFNLRRFSELPPARRAINAMCNPILDQPWVIEPVPDLLGEIDPTAEIPAEQKARIRLATESLLRPNDDEGWRTVLEQVLEDVVIGGYGAIEVVKTGDRKRPIALYPVDGQSIRINTSWTGIEPDEARYTQSLGYTGMSVTTHEAVKLRDDQLIYIRLNPRTNTPFGLGYLEVAFETINAFMGAFDFATRRASNATPAYGIFLGENVDIATARQWQRYWQQEIEGYGRVPIIGGGRQPSVFHLSQASQDQLWIDWQEFLIRVISMAFGLSPMALGLERDVNRSTAEQNDASDWDTVSPVANTFQHALTNRLLHRILGWEDLRFRWLVRDTDEYRQAEILQLQYDMNAITVNEIRETYDRPPMEEEWGELTKTRYEAKAQTEFMPELPEMGGPPLEEPAEPEEEKATV